MASELLDIDWLFVTLKEIVMHMKFWYLMHCQINKTHRVIGDAFLKCWLPEGSQHAHYIFHRAEYTSIQRVGKGQLESKRLGKTRYYSEGQQG